MEVQPVDSMRRLCRVPDDAPVWVMRLPAGGPEEGLPYLQIYAREDDGCPLASNVIRSTGTVTHERIAGRDTLLSFWDDGTGNAFFRASGLTIEVYAFGGTGSEASENQANFRRILEGLQRVHVTPDGKIVNTP